MLGSWNCRSSSSSSPSQISSVVRNLENGFLQSILKSPRISSSTCPNVRSEKKLHEQIPPTSNSEKEMASNASEKGFQLQSSVELKNEIDMLEVEIVHLERRLLSLYRTVYEEQTSLSNAKFEYNTSSLSVVLPKQMHCKAQPCIRKSDFGYLEEASPAHNLAVLGSRKFSPSLKASSGEDMKRSSSGHRSLADLFGSCHTIVNHHTPDRLSEEIMRCISTIYCKLSATKTTHSVLSPSSLSSSSIFSSKNPGDSWSPRFSEDSNSKINHNFEESGYQCHAASAVEVLKICLDEASYKFAAVMLKEFRSLVRNLEKVDPRKMKREERLAFWINIHNALVLHAYLAFGTHNRVKSSTILKAEYNVGGLCINAFIIQSSILGIRPNHSAPWLHQLFSPGRKNRTASVRHEYALEYPEPLVHFALCSGAFSDPMVRVYTARSIFHDLKNAKEEFIQGNVYIEKGSKILLPKLIYYYSKDLSLDMVGLLESVSKNLSESQKKAIRKCSNGKYEKCIQWLPQNSNFRYVFHGELARGRIKI